MTSLKSTCTFRGAPEKTFKEKSMDSEIRLLSRLEAAKALGIGKSNLSELINEGRIGFISIGKRIFIPFKEIQHFINTNTARLTPKTDHDSSKDEYFDSVQFINNLINNNQ